MKEIISNLRDLNIGIVGCGWLGTRMAEKWQRNNLLYTTTTSPQKLPVLEAQGFHPFCIDFNSSRVEEVSRWDVMEKLDVLIITVPISSRKDRSLQNIEQRIRNLTLFLGRFEGQLFFMDSTSIYPAEKREFTEDDVSVEEVAAERLLRKSYPEVNILRLGGLMGDERQLGKYAVTDLDAPVNHIHFKDIIAIVEQMIQKQCRAKVYNVVAPVHPQKGEVIAIQKNQSYAGPKVEKGRIISSDKLLIELTYDFIYPDPRYFHISPGLADSIL